MKNPATLFTPTHDVAAQKNEFLSNQQGDRTHLFLPQILGLIAGLSVATSMAIAQTEDSSTSEGQSMILENIIVTAQRREQSLLDVPVAVSVVDAGVLEASFISNLEDLQRMVPSITISGSLSPTESSVRLRGVGTNVFSVTVEPSVSFVVDGVPLPRNDAGLVEFADIERVEVLKGPQGTLFGKNASAGVISYTTKGPSETFTGLVKLRGTADQDFRFDGSVSDTLSNGVGYRFSGFYSETADYLKNVYTGTESSGNEAFGFRGKLRFDVSDKFSLQVSADYYDVESSCCSLPLRSNAGPNILNLAVGVEPGLENTGYSSDFNPVNTTSQHGVSVTAEWELENHNLVSVTSYRDWETGGDLNDTDFFASDGANAPVLGGVGLQQQAYQEAQTFSQEIRLSPLSSERFDYVVGAFYFKNDLGRFFDRNTQLCFAPGPNGCGFPVLLDSFFTLNVDTENYAVFGDGSYSLNDSLSLIGGIRVLRDILTFDTNTSAGFEGGDTLKDTDTIGRLGLQYRLSDSLSSYLTFSKGYKSGAYDATIAINSDVLEGGPVAPETSDAIEIGIRGVFESLPELFFDLSAFQNTYNDFHVQSFDTSGAGGSKLQNAGETETKGIELAVSWAPSDEFSLSMNALYLDAKFTDFDGVGCYLGQTLAQGCTPRPGGNTLQDVSGSTLPNAPELKLSVLPRYETQLSSGRTVFAQALVSYQSEVKYNINQDPRAFQKGYTLVDLSAGFKTKDDRYLVTIFAKNVFDKFHTSSVGAMFLNDPGGYYHIVPRSVFQYVGVELAANF
jgi:iron complex outermembrane receptor protein